MLWLVRQGKMRVIALPILLVLSGGVVASALLVWLAAWNKKPPPQIAASEVVTNPASVEPKKTVSLAFSGDAQSDHKNPDRFMPRTFVGMEWQRQFRLPHSTKQSGGLATTACLELDIDKLNTRLADFRAGFTELNETKENANKITLTSLQWTLRCEGELLVAEGTLENSSYGKFSIRLTHLLKERFKLVTIEASRKGIAGASVKMASIEFRANEQRRGQILSQGIQVTDGASIGYDSASIGEQGANDVSNLYHNSEWLDFALRGGEKKILLSVELPVLREVGSSP